MKKTLIAICLMTFMCSCSLFQDPKERKHPYTYIVKFKDGTTMELSGFAPE